MQRLHRLVTLRRFNNLLTVVVLALGVYIMVTPYAPAITWWVKHEAPVVSSAPTVNIPEKTALPDNTLVIPSLGMQQLIHSGPTAAELNKGVWLRPNTSTPDQGSNTVLAGHRFTYSDPAVFYHLDKVKRGDEIQMHWEDKLYTYKVTDIQTVLPTAVEVEAPTDSTQLTIYTCTPLWSSKYRLVIIAEPVEES